MEGVFGNEGALPFVTVIVCAGACDYAEVLVRFSWYEALHDLLRGLGCCPASRELRAAEFSISAVIG
jgi:hypothetical protein